VDLIDGQVIGLPLPGGVWCAAIVEAFDEPNQQVSTRR
jgi:hypothetical protein